MRIEQLKYLIEIGHSNSINEASQRLHVSHQAISTAIKTLEDELGVSLVKRGYKGTVLTSEGKYVVKATMEFFYKIDRICKLDKSSIPMRGTLSIVSTNFAMEMFLSPTVVAYYNHYPQVKVNLTRKVAKQTILEFAQGKYDLAFLAMVESDIAKLREAMGLIFEPCTEICTYIEVSKYSSIAQYKSVSLNMLKNYQVIYNCPQEIAEAQKNNWPFHYIQGRKVRYEASPRVYQELLLSDYGVGILEMRKDRPLERKKIDIVAIPVRDAPKHFFGYLIQQEPLSVLAQAFLQLLCS